MLNPSRLRCTLIAKIFFLLTVAVKLTFAQSAVKVTGQVVDARTNQPLPGANVLVVGSALGAATNSFGRFEIENLLNGQYQLRATFIGYKARYQNIFVTDGAPTEVLFQLEPKVLEVDEVHVSASRFDASPGTSTIILSQRDIERSQATSVGELLKNVPGLEIQDAGAQGEKRVSIRGSRSNQVLVLLDGVKLNNELTGDVDLSVVPVSSIEKIKVQTGSASAEYGSGAIGGVIDIISARAAKSQLKLAAQRGSFGLLNIEPSLAFNWQGVNFLGAFQAIQSDGNYAFSLVSADDSAEQQRRINADMWSTNIFGRLSYVVRRHQFSLRYQHFDSERGNPGRIHYLTPNARSILNRQIWGGDYYFIGKKIHLQLQANLKRNESTSANLRPEQSDLPFGATPEFHFQNQLKTEQYRAKLQHHTTTWLTNHVGIESRNLSFQDRNLLIPESSPIGEAEDISYAMFFRQDYDFSFSKIRLHFSPALRYDEATLHSERADRFEYQWSPQLHSFFSFGARNKIYVKSNIGRAFRMPTFADLFYQDFRVQGKADLLPEKSVNQELGLGSQFSLFGEWRFEISTFRNTINDMIVWRLGSFEFFRPYNTNAEIFGEEYSVSYETFADVLHLTGSYTHLEALNKNDNVTLYDRYLPYRPEHSIKATLDVNFSSWRTSLIYRHVGERFITEANTKSMPAYAVVDWTASWNVKGHHLKYKVQAAVYNALNEQYQIMRDMPLPGREWRIGLNISYN